MVSLIGNLEPFIPGGNFSAYEDRLNQFFLVNKVVENKTAMFLTIAGPDIYEVLMSLTVPDLPSSKKYDDLIKLLREHFTPRTNKRAERYRFYKAFQQEGEIISEFIVRLRSLSQSCQFGGFINADDKNIAQYKLAILNDALTDRFIIGLRNSKIQQMLLDNDKLSFEECCSRALNSEMAERESKAIRPSSVNNIKGQKSYQSTTNSSYNNQKSRHRSQSKGKHLDVVNSSSRNRSSYRNEDQKCSKCYRCGHRHREENCPARNWECFSCHKKGHTSVKCPGKNHVGVMNNIKTINSVLDSHKPSEVCVNVSSREIIFEVDTGACVTVMCKKEYRDNFSKIPLYKFSSNILTITGESIKELGKFDAEVSFGNVSCNLTIVVVDSDKPFRALMGRNWLDVLFLNWRNLFTNNMANAVREKNSNILNEIKSKFPNIVSKNLNHPIDGYMVDIVLKENAVPIFHAPYNVPYKLRDKLKEELDRLVAEQVLLPVKRSRWASPVVLVPKPNGNIRMCIDCKVTINKFIESEYYPLPKLEDIFASLANCKVFCVIDLTGAYQQLALSPESQELLTINTFFGLFQYTRLSFGVSTAPMIFQSVMDQILLGIKNVQCFLDDIIIGAASFEECRTKLLEVLCRLNKHQVKINMDKCRLLEKEVKYLGHVLCDGKISPNPEKIKAIVEASPPSNITQLQAFLGLVNFYGRFIPNLSSELSVLYKLLRKDVKFEWNGSCQKTFQNCKKLILSNNVLELYDPNKQIILTTDASPYGVGAVLSHLINGIEKPVMFASSSLSAAEKNYSQTHREALAIVFGLRKFHSYLYGHRFTIYTDHQALKEIFNPKKCTPAVATARMQRWSVILSMYNYNIEYRRGSEMSNADALSRLPLKEATGIEDISINFFNFSDELPVNFKQIQDETLLDPILSPVYKFVMDGWPKNIPKELKQYHAKSLSLHTEDGVLYYMNRIVIPKSCQSSVLKLLHENHTGTVRMKMLARSYVWWILCDKDVESYVSSCLICQQTQNVPKEICSTTWPITTYPFKRVHLDFF